MEAAAIIPGNHRSHLNSTSTDSAHLKLNLPPTQLLSSCHLRSGHLSRRAEFISFQFLSIFYSPQSTLFNSNLSSTSQQPHSQAIETLSGQLLFLYFLKDHRPSLDWPSRGVINFDMVSVAYSADTKPVITDLSFETKPAEKIGIVGRTGAGKVPLFLFR